MNTTIKKNIRWLFLSALAGALSGVASTIFLASLNWVTNTRDQTPFIIWLLPAVGFFIGWAYYHFGKDVAAGNNLIFEEIHDPKKVVPIRMAPFIYFGTLLTHLFGGSAGREGTAVQMGASLSDQLSHFFSLDAQERKILLMAASGASFGAALGTPIAGVFFGMEVLYAGKLQLSAWYECAIASMAAYTVSLLLGAPHTVYPGISVSDYSLKTFLFITIAGIVFGLAARFFSFITHLIEKGIRFISYPPLKPFVGGLLLIGLFYWEGSYRYVGLGIPNIQDALQSPVELKVPLLKSLFTSLTIASGFKGGEFIPLVFVGTTLGSALSIVLPISFSLMAAVGFAAVFAGAANIPITCAFMAIEIFGYPIAPYAFLGCFMSYFFSGRRGIYHAQKARDQKAKTLVSHFWSVQSLIWAQKKQ